MRFGPLLGASAGILSGAFAWAGCHDPAPIVTTPAAQLKPTATPVPAAPRDREYSRTGEGRAVVDERGPFADAVSSPDGRLAALTRRRGSTVLIYDLERDRVVARLAASQGKHAARPSWADDETLVTRGVPGLADDAGIRVIAAPDGEMPPSSPVTDADRALLKRLERLRWNRVFHAEGSTFVAQCGNGSVGWLGDETSARRAASKGVVSSATHRASWKEGEGVVHVEGPSKAFEVDAGGPVVRVLFHPDGQELVTAAHAPVTGMGFHHALVATVRSFDLASGAQKREWHGVDARFSDDGSKLLISDELESTLLDAKTYARLRVWKSLYPQVLLDRSGAHALVALREKPPSGLGPAYRTALFVDDVARQRRVLDLGRAEGFAAFGSASPRLAFAEQAHEFDDNVRSVAFIDLANKKASRTAATFDEPISDLKFLPSDLLAAESQGRLVLLRGDGARLTIHAREEEKACRVFALDERGRFQGVPGDSLGYRFGDDARTAVVDTSEDELRKHRHETLVTEFLAGQ